MLSSIVPQAEYAEDQKADKAVLWTHVLYRGLQTGAVLGIGVGLGRAALMRRRNPPSSIIQQAILRSTGIGATAGTALMVLAVPGRMHGRDEIEWKDRSYRLLGNKYQEQVDDWTVPTTLLGLGIGIVSTRTSGSWATVIGSAGVGSLTGLAAMMIYRLAVRKESAETAKPSAPLPSPV